MCPPQRNSASYRYWQATCPLSLFVYEFLIHCTSPGFFHLQLLSCFPKELHVSSRLDSKITCTDTYSCLVNHVQRTIFAWSYCCFHCVCRETHWCLFPSGCQSDAVNSYYPCPSTSSQIMGFKSASFYSNSLMKERIDENHPWVTDDGPSAELPPSLLSIFHEIYKSVLLRYFDLSLFPSGGIQLAASIAFTLCHVSMYVLDWTSYVVGGSVVEHTLGLVPITIMNVLN